MSVLPETRELEGLLDASRVALAELDQCIPNLRRDDPAQPETLTAMIYLQSLLKRIETELLQIL